MSNLPLQSYPDSIIYLSISYTTIGWVATKTQFYHQIKPGGKKLKMVQAADLDDHAQLRLTSWEVND